MSARSRQISLAASGWPTAGRDAAIIVAAAVFVLAVPPAIYGYLSYRQFDYFRLTYYIPYEQLLSFARAFDIVGLLGAPVVSANMTSGLLLANIYELTLGQMLLSISLGLVIGANVTEHLKMRAVCATGRGSEVALGTGSGLFSTVAASSTGILGCCGGSVSGGVLALAGIGYSTATQLANLSPAIQVAMIVLLAFNYLRLTRRVARASVPSERGPA